MTQDERVQAILTCGHRGNIPHPSHPGKRIVGWIVDQDVAGLSEALSAVEEIERLTAALEGSVAVPAPSDDLVQQCRELLEWSTTGLLNGGSGGAVREFAEKWEVKVGRHNALSVAEKEIRDSAMRELVRLADALPRHKRDTATDGVA